MVRAAVVLVSAERRLAQPFSEEYSAFSKSTYSFQHSFSTMNGSELV
jgi:hypothetical protein